MSEVPELRAAVRVSAERRYGRRRRRLARRSLPVVAAVAAVLAALVLLPDAGRDEVPASPPSPTTTASAEPPTKTKESAMASLASVFGVFRRPQQEKDRVAGLLAGVPRLARGVTLDL